MHKNSNNDEDADDDNNDDTRDDGIWSIGGGTVHCQKKKKKAPSP